MPEPIGPPMSWSQAKNITILYESDHDIITRDGTEVHLDHLGPWTTAHTRLTRTHKVNSLKISEFFDTPWATLRFLLDLPPLRHLHVVLCRPNDLSPLGELTGLTYLGVMGRPCDEHASAAVDLSRPGLKRAYLDLSPAVESVLNCPTLEWLWLWNREGPPLQELRLERLCSLRELHVTACPKIKKLELGSQPLLERLHFEACPKLREIHLHTKAHVQCLKMGGCGSFRIDWKRMGPHLKELELVGRLQFSLEEVLNAPTLQRLHVDGVRTFPPLKFLLRLARLHEFIPFAAPPGPKFSNEDLEVIRTINRRTPKS